MRLPETVFAIVPDCHTTTGYYRSLWRHHFYDGLRSVVGHLLEPQQVDFDWARGANQPQRGAASVSARTLTTEQLWSQIQAARERCGLDLVISYCYSHDLEPGLVQRVIGSGVPWINFFCDSTHWFPRVESLAKVVSLNWFPEHGAIGKYQALGTPFACLPYAFNPDHLPEAGARTARYAVGFVGLPTTNRITQLGCLRLLGCPAEIRGQGWIEPAADPFGNPEPLRRRWRTALAQKGLAEKVARRLLWPLVRRQARGPLDDAEFYEFLRQTQIVLGLNQARDEQGRLSSYLKFRDMEFPGYGCCYLSEHNADIEAVFAVGQEVLTYRSMREAAALIRRGRRDPDWTREIGRAARRRVLAEHTWAVRLKQMIQLL